jgi:hypothetical protein
MSALLMGDGGAEPPIQHLQLTRARYRRQPPRSILS